MKNNMGLFVDEIKTWDGFEMIAEKMENLVAKFEDHGHKIYATNGCVDGFNVLNHGDFHFNNMMFKKDSTGKLSDVMFVSLILCKKMNKY
jgi:thiamine kinase-like enzyme